MHFTAFSLFERLLIAYSLSAKCVGTGRSYGLTIFVFRTSEVSLQNALTLIAGTGLTGNFTPIFREVRHTFPRITTFMSTFVSIITIDIFDAARTIS